MLLDRTRLIFDTLLYDERRQHDSTPVVPAADTAMRSTTDLQIQIIFGTRINFHMSHDLQKHIIS